MRVGFNLLQLRILAFTRSLSVAFFFLRAPQYSALACAPGRCCGLVLRLLRFLPGFCCFSFSGLWMSDIIQRLASVIAQAMLGMALEKFFEGIFGLVVLLQVFLI